MQIVSAIDCLCNYAYLSHTAADIGIPIMQLAWGGGREMKKDVCTVY